MHKFVWKNLCRQFYSKSTEEYQFLKSVTENRITNRLRSREKEARAKRVFTFPGAITTESEVARSATAYAKRMDSGVGDSPNKGY